MFSECGLGEIWFIFIICRFRICELAYSLKFICNPQINTHSVLWSFICRHEQSSKKFESHSQLKLNKALPFAPSFQCCKHLLVSWSIKCPVFHILCFLLVISLFTVAPKYIDEVLLVFWSARKLCCALGRKCIWLDR